MDPVYQQRKARERERQVGLRTDDPQDGSFFRNVGHSNDRDGGGDNNHHQKKPAKILTAPDRNQRQQWKKKNEIVFSRLADGALSIKRSVKDHIEGNHYQKGD